MRQNEIKTENDDQTPAVMTDEELRELGMHGRPDFPAECKLHDPLSFDAIPHWHDDIELTYICSGKVSVMAGQFEGILEAGDFMLINSGVLHSLYRIKSEQCIMKTIIFDPHLVGGSEDSIYWKKYMEPFIHSKAHQVIKLPEDSEITELFKLVWDECNNKNDGYEINIRAWLSQMIWKLSRMTLAEQNEFRSDRDHERIKQMIMFMENHYGEKISIADIAQSVSISESECIRCFRRAAKDTPIRYLTELRLQKAARRLESASDDIGNIGYDCGFAEPSYFIRLFKKAYGMTPGRYRNKYYKNVTKIH